MLIDYYHSYDISSITNKLRKMSIYELYEFFVVVDKDIAKGCISHSLPSQEDIINVRNFFEGKKSLEIFAGQGLWSYLLRAEGCDIISSDSCVSYYEPSVYLFDDVKNQEASECVKEYNPCNLLIVWPPYDNSAYKALNEFKGSKVVYVGGLNCGDDDMKELFEKEYICKEIYNRKEDTMYFYEKKM